jgi:CrcB protein
MRSYLMVAAGGALGSLARYGVSDAFSRWFGETFPLGTLVANVSGSFAIGFLATLMGPEGRLLVNPEWRVFLLIGLFGGYTTFSSFSLQTLALAQSGEWMKAGANVLFSVLLCLLAVWLGHIAAEIVGSTRRH